MTQNTEQNVRTFDTQISMMAEFIRTGPSGKGLEGWLSAHIRAAEARGAAEERAKSADAANDEIAGWTWEHDHGLPDVAWVRTYGEMEPPHDCEWIRNIEPVYSHPANVAALEEALLDPATVHQNMLRGSIAKPTWDQIKHLYAAEFATLEARAKKLEEALHAVREAIETADPAVLICTLWMPKGAETVHDFISAALTREGGV